MDSETRREIEDLKLSLSSLANEESRLMKELEAVRARSKEAYDRLKVLSNDNEYQKNMLELVYEQRQKDKKK